MIRLIGYWKASFDDEYPIPQELETEYAPDVREALATYLESGTLFIQYRGPSWCRYACGQSANGSRELYDGEWAWPEGLAHYLRVHSVGLPPDFIQHAASARRTGPPSANPEDRREELDDAYWIEWARPHRTPAVTKLLEAAREAAGRACDARFDAQAAELAARHGVGESTCGWQGCDRRVLIGKAICARHAANNQFSWIRGQVEYEALHNLARELPQGPDR